MGVDGQVPGPDGRRDAQRPADVPGPQGPGEAVVGGVGQADGVGLVVERQHDGDGTEDLLDGHPRVRVHAGQDGGREPEAGALGRLAADAVGAGRDVGADPVQLGAGDQRAHLGLLVGRVADPYGLDGGGEQVQEPVVHGPLDEDAGAGAAVLAGVVEEGHGGGGRGRLQVGVGEDDVGALAAEFQGDALEEGRALGQHLSAHGGGPREDDLGDARVLDEGVAGDGTVAGQHLEQVLGESGGQGEFGQAQRGQRGRLGGLEDHRVARGEGRGGAPGGDRHGEVPGRDDADDAERFEDGDVEAAGDRDLAAGEPLDAAGRVVEQVADVAGLPAGVADGVAGLADLQQGQFLEVVVDGGGEAAQQAGAVAGREGGPAGLGPRGPYDGGVDVGLGGAGDGGDDLLGRRVQDVECVLVRHEGPHMRSKERRSSQSVTAASKASTSTRAMLR